MNDRAVEPREALADGACEFCNRTWWAFLIGGLASIAFGVLAFVSPGAALLVLGLFFAAFVLVDGAVNTWGAIRNRGRDGWWAMLLIGLLGIAVGGYALWVPALSMLAFVLMAGAVALVVGLSTIYLGYRVREEIRGEWVLYLTGALSVLFAILIIARPDIGGLSVVYLVAAWAIVIGLLRVFLAFRVRGLRDRIGELAAGSSG